MTALERCLALTALYVGVLQLPFNRGDRNASRIVWSRGASSVAVALLGLWLLYGDLGQSAERLGAVVVGSAGDAGQSLFLVLLFFIAVYLGEAAICIERRQLPYRAVSTATALRDLVVAPVAEEAVFRAALCPVFEREGYGTAGSVVVPALVFGVAHLHHVRRLRSELGSWRSAVAAIAFAGLYTTVFGAYAGWVFVKSGSVVGPLVAHSVANFFGPPDWVTALRHRRWVYLVALDIAGLCVGLGTVALLV